MPLLIPVIAVGSLIVSGLFGASSLVSATKDAEEEASKTAVNFGGLIMLALGAWLVFNMMKKRR